jgi:hypothetical protein
MANVARKVLWLCRSHAAMEDLTVAKIESQVMRDLRIWSLKQFPRFTHSFRLNPLCVKNRAAQFLNR